MTSTRSARLRAQRLDQASRLRSSSVAEVTRDVAGLQAQDDRAAALGIRVRSRGLTSAAVAAARGTDRSIVRAWCMRGTVHLVAASDLRDLLTVFGPVFVPRGRRRLAQFGLDEQTCDRAMSVMRDELGEHGPLTRHEIAAALVAAGIPADAHRQAPVHLVARACLLGIACEAGTGDGEPVYTLLDTWVPGAARERPVALAALARRYLAAHQPAGRGDFAAWAGLPAADVRAAWEAISGELEPVHDADPGLWRLAGAGQERDAEPATPVVRLLPAFDDYLLGYRGRGHVVDPAHWSAVHPGGGIIRPTVLVDGMAAATWRIDRSRRSTRVVVQPFARIGAAAEEAVQAEAADVGRFLDGAPYQVSWTRGSPTYPRPVPR